MLGYKHGKDRSRKLSQDAQYQIRCEVVKLRQRGMSYADIAEVVGVSLSYACRLYKRYEREGMQGISKGQRGRRIGQQWTLDTEQEAAVRRTIQDGCPVEDAVCPMDSSGGTGVDQAPARHKDADPNGGVISYAVGFYTTEADP